MEKINYKKLYSQQGISIATFFGGPLAAGYLIRKNFIALGKEREGLISIILGTIFTAAIIVPIILLPEEIVDKIPNQLIPLIYTIIIYGIVEVIQGKDLKTHKEEERKFESNWKATSVGFICMLVFGGLIVTYIFTSPNINSELDEEIAQKMEQISINEEKALKLYSLDPNTASKEEILNAVMDEGIFYWNLNLQLLEEIQQVELEESFAEYVNKLFIYTRARQESYILIMKSIGEDTDKYNLEIEQKNRSIEVLLKELEQMSL